MQPERPVDEQIGYLVKRLQQLIRGAIDDRLARHGASMAAYAALAALDQYPGLSNAELARRCFVTPQTMNEIVHGLADEGLVERRPRPDHGRILQTHLTGRGRDLVRACQREVDAVHDRMLAGFDDGETDRLRDLLARCIAALDT